MDEELERIQLVWLLEQGSYFPMADHLVPPDVRLANYTQLMRRLREMATAGA